MRRAGRRGLAMAVRAQALSSARRAARAPDEANAGAPGLRPGGGARQAYESSTAAGLRAGRGLGAAVARAAAAGIACVVRAACAALICMCVLAASAAAAVVTGVSDQRAAFFDSPLVPRARARRGPADRPVGRGPARRSVGRVDRPRAARRGDASWSRSSTTARAAARARRASCRPSAPTATPSAALLAKYPSIREVTAWNEPNHNSQPTFRHPDAAARYYEEARARCPGVHDRRGRRPRRRRAPELAVRRTRPRSTSTPAVWGLHNYYDSTYFRSRGVQTMLDSDERPAVADGDRRDRLVRQPRLRRAARGRRRRVDVRPRRPLSRDRADVPLPVAGNARQRLRLRPARLRRLAAAGVRRRGRPCRSARRGRAGRAARPGRHGRRRHRHSRPSPPDPRSRPPEATPRCARSAPCACSRAAGSWFACAASRAARVRGAAASAWSCASPARWSRAWRSTSRRAGCSRGSCGSRSDARRHLMRARRPRVQLQACAPRGLPCTARSDVAVSRAKAPTRP